MALAPWSFCHRSHPPLTKEIGQSRWLDGPSDLWDHNSHFHLKTFSGKVMIRTSSEDTYSLPCLFR